jgi:hypothetical protein
MTTSKKAKPSNGTSPIKVGDEVSFMYGFRKARAEVVEDRGFVGAGGRRILRVKLISRSPGEDRTFEIPQDEVLAVS